MSAKELYFELPGSAHVLFTTRLEGNMSSTNGEDRGSAAGARAALLARTGAQELARSLQIHGAGVRRWEAGGAAAIDAELEVEADGHVTADPGLALMVLAADCLPVGLASPSAVGMLHAGWRGLAAGILERGVSALQEAGSEPASEVVAVLGPCAGACCYEVGPEVHAALGGTADGITGGTPGARGKIDLREIARRRLFAAGIHAVLDAPACTICEPALFSHRREGPRAGRQAGVAWRD